MNDPNGLIQPKQITLRVFLDHSVIEVNVDDRYFLSGRIYPQGEDSHGLRLSVHSGVLGVDALTIWQMKSIWQS